MKPNSEWDTIPRVVAFIPNIRSRAGFEKMFMTTTQPLWFAAIAYRLGSTLKVYYNHDTQEYKLPRLEDDAFREDRIPNRRTVDFIRLIVREMSPEHLWQSRVSELFDHLLSEFQQSVKIELCVDWPREKNQNNDHRRAFLFDLMDRDPSRVSVVLRHNGPYDMPNYIALWYYRYLEHLFPGDRSRLPINLSMLSREIDLRYERERERPVFLQEEFSPRVVRDPSSQTETHADDPAITGSTLFTSFVDNVALGLLPGLRYLRIDPQYPIAPIDLHPIARSLRVLELNSREMTAVLLPELSNCLTLQVLRLEYICFDSKKPNSLLPRDYPQSLSSCFINIYVPGAPCENCHSCSEWIRWLLACPEMTSLSLGPWTAHHALQHPDYNPQYPDDDPRHPEYDPRHPEYDPDYDGALWGFIGLSMDTKRLLELSLSCPEREHTDQRMERAAATPFATSKELRLSFPSLERIFFHCNSDSLTIVFAANRTFCQTRSAKRQAWMAIAVLTAFSRANRDHIFHTSIIPLIPSITALTQWRDLPGYMYETPELYWRLRERSYGRNGLHESPNHEVYQVYSDEAFDVSWDL